eukprot:4445149-Pleurochrysis_carterae.AAC.2
MHAPFREYPSDSAKHRYKVTSRVTSISRVTCRLIRHIFFSARQGMRLAASAISFNTAQVQRLGEGEGLVPSHRAAARRNWQRGQEQVVPRSGQCRMCVSAAAVKYTESDERRTGS